VWSARRVADEFEDQSYLWTAERKSSSILHEPECLDSARPLASLCRRASFDGVTRWIDARPVKRKVYRLYESRISSIARPEPGTLKSSVSCWASFIPTWCDHNRQSWIPTAEDWVMVMGRYDRQRWGIHGGGYSQPINWSETIDIFAGLKSQPKATVPLQ